MTPEEIEDIVINLFTDKYDRRTKLQALSCGEIDRTIDELIKKHQPDFWDFGFDKPMVFTLSDAMKFYEENPDLFKVPGFSYMKMKKDMATIFSVPDELIDQLKKSATTHE